MVLRIASKTDETCSRAVALPPAVSAKQLVPFPPALVAWTLVALFAFSLPLAVLLCSCFLSLCSGLAAQARVWIGYMRLYPV
jgi:hypothetical protein